VSDLEADLVTAAVLAYDAIQASLVMAELTNAELKAIRDLLDVIEHFSLEEGQ
jgi:hypothetical protein